VLRRCVWSRNIKNGCSIYIYDISHLRVKESAELYLYSLLCPFIVGHRVTITFFTSFNYGISEVRVVTENSNFMFETPCKWCFYSMDLIWVIPVLHKWYEMCRSSVIWIWFIWSAWKSSQLNIDIYVNIYSLIMRHAVQFI